MRFRVSNKLWSFSTYGIRGKRKDKPEEVMGRAMMPSRYCRGFIPSHLSTFPPVATMYLCTAEEQSPLTSGRRKNPQATLEIRHRPQLSPLWLLDYETSNRRTPRGLFNF